MLEYVHATLPVEVWTAPEIREDSPEDTDAIADDELGVLFHSGDGDGALIIGTPDEIIKRLTAVIDYVRERELLRADQAAITDDDLT